MQRKNKSDILQTNLIYNKSPKKMKKYLVTILVLIGLNYTTQAQEEQETEIPEVVNTDIDEEEALRKIKEEEKKAEKARKEAEKARKEAEKTEKKHKKEQKKLKKQEKLMNAIASRKKSIAKDEKKILNLEEKLRKGTEKGKLSPVDIDKINAKIGKLQTGLIKENGKLQKLMKKL